VHSGYLQLATGRFALFLIAMAVAGGAAAQGDPKRGEYLSKAGGCVACHTEEKEGAVRYAGGRALKTPFGTFYGPNITPHPNAGIGDWKEADFVRAMREGVSPEGDNYFPAFPYTSFTKMTDADLADLWAYLRTIPPSDKASRTHDLKAPYGWRWLVTPWKWLYFRPGPFKPDPAASPTVNRGAYLVQALGHCGECHTPRNLLGAPRADRYLAGGKGPEGKRVPNLTPTGLSRWSDAELTDFLVTGLTPDGDIAAQAMGEVIRNTTSQWTRKDLGAVIAFLRSLPARADEPR